MCTCCGAEAPALWLHDGKTGMGGSGDGRSRLIPNSARGGVGKRKGAANELFLNVAHRLSSPTGENPLTSLPLAFLCQDARQTIC